MFSNSKLKDKIGLLYYRHGLFCASNPISCLLICACVVVVCCYPITYLTSFSSSLEKYSQPISSFDGLEATPEINEFINYNKLPDRPAWYNHIPVGYIQRIIVKSVLTIPDVHTTDHKIFFEKTNHSPTDSTLHLDTHQLFLIDAFRTSIAQAFEVNEYLRGFRDENEQSLVNDLCLHVGELKAKTEYDQADQNAEKETEHSGKNYFPEFNCLYLSPTNFWANDMDAFLRDSNIMRTIKNLNDLQTEEITKATLSKDKKPRLSFLASFISFFDRIHLSSGTIAEKITSTSSSELLFGVARNTMLSLLKDNTKLADRVANDEQTKAKLNRSVVFTYAITIAFKKYDRVFIDKLNEGLQSRFGHRTGEAKNSKTTDDMKIVNLQYLNQSFLYYIPYLVLYFLLFLYIYISVRKIELVKSKWGLAFAAVIQVFLSLLMSIGICTFFGLIPTLNGGEIFPYLIIFIGFENIVALTKSIVSTPFDLDVRYRIALGLKKESWLITKILSCELIIICCGFITMVPAIQEFCMFAYVGLLIDFFMQMIFFVTVLSIDIRRMELSDLNRHYSLKEEEASNTELRQKQTNEYIAKFGDLITPNEIENKLIYRDQPNKSLLFSSFSLTKKSVQFFYFWARTRLIQRALIALSILWIILIFYKSLLVVELLRHDVNISVETAKTLVPKSGGFQKLLFDERQSYMFASTPVVKPDSVDRLQTVTVRLTGTRNGSSASTINYLYNFFTIKMVDSSDERNKEQLEKQAFANSKIDHTWDTLNYYHWLTLFHNYNMSLYNRYVAILPEIGLERVVKHADILKYRHLKELRAYNSVLVAQDDEIFIKNNLMKVNEKANKVNLNIGLDRTDSGQEDFVNDEEKSLFKWALFELLGIVILGIPTIFLVLYTLTLFYKCLCSKSYEEWLKTWSTSNIKRQYKKIHSKPKQTADGLLSTTINKSKCRKRNVKRDYSSSSSVIEDEYFTSDSDYESFKVVENKSSTENFSDNELKLDTLLNKIINGQNYDVDLITTKSFNSRSTCFFHKYPIDLMRVGSFKCATSDINNQIFIWSLNTSLKASQAESSQVPNFDLNLVNPNGVAVWTMCITADDKYLVAGHSNGLLRVFNLEISQQEVVYNSVESCVSDENNGITHVISLNNFGNKNHHFLIVHLNSFIQLLKYSDTNFHSILSCQVHTSPITSLAHSQNSPYLITASQDMTFNLYKLTHNDSELSIDQNIDMKLIKTEQTKSDITTLIIHEQTAAIGTNEGLIYIWDLVYGRLKLCLNKKKQDKKLNGSRGAIIELVIASSSVISLNEERQMCLWNRSSGCLIKEFTFLTPVTTNVSLPKLVFSNFLSLLSLRSMNKTFVSSDYVDNDNQPAPTMCLYSKNLLITGGCSCIFIWNINNGGELVKKINIIKPNTVHTGNKKKADKFGQKYFVRHIEVVRQKSPKQWDHSSTHSKHTNKLILITDYTDSIYLLKMPVYIMQELG